MRNLLLCSEKVTKSKRQFANTGTLSERTTRKFVEDGTIPSFKIGNRSYIDYNNAIKTLEKKARGEQDE